MQCGNYYIRKCRHILLMIMNGKKMVDYKKKVGENTFSEINQLIIMKPHIMEHMK